MVHPATEVAISPVRADATIEAPDSEAGKAWQEFLKILLAQEGIQRVHWGRQVEDPNVVEMLVDWDAVESHQKFAQSEAYGPFNDLVRPLLNGVPTVYHTHCAPESPASLLSRTPSGIIEHLICYFEPNLGEADRTRWGSVWGTFMKVLAEHAAGFKGFTSGWVLEEVQYEGNAATGFVATLGWDSVEVHLAYRDTKEFQESILPVREGCKGRAVHHVKFQEAKN